MVYNGDGVPSISQANLEGLKSGQGYTVGVKARNRAGWSTMSPMLQFTAGKLPSAPPMAPTLISSSDTQIQFKWEPSLDIGGAQKLDSYNIYSGNVLIATVLASQLSYTYTSVTAGLAFPISISAISSIGESPLSLPSTFWAVSTPSAPTVSVTGTTRDSCTL